MSRNAGLIMGLLGCLIAQTAVADPVSSDGNFLSIGAGNWSCATWLSSPSNELAGKNWLLGFWSGTNNSSSSHTVGIHSDITGITAEVTNVCKSSPSKLLYSVVNRVYEMMQSRGQ